MSAALLCLIQIKCISLLTSGAGFLFHFRRHIQAASARLGEYCFSKETRRRVQATLVLIALVLVLHTTKLYGPWHHAKNMYRVDAQPLLLIGAEG